MIKPIKPEGHMPPPQVVSKVEKEIKKAVEQPKTPATPKEMRAATKSPYGLDSHAMAQKLATLASMAKSKEITKDLSMAEIIAKVIKETGILNPQEAMEEANRKLQKEIEDELERIKKKGKQLGEEKEAWEGLADLLESALTEEQRELFLQALRDSIRGV